VLSKGEGAQITRGLLEPWLRGTVPMPGSSLLEVKPGNGIMPAVFQVGDRTLEEIEREAIVQTLHRFKGHRQKTAKLLGIGVRTLGLKLKKWKNMQLVEETL
jgi:DNA-binding NtrC family response regulator